MVEQISQGIGKAAVKPALRIVLLVVIGGCLIAIAAVSFHSVGEIHYLKSFYPRSFSVSDASSASVVELIKVSLVAFPIFLTILVCLFLLWLFNKGNNVHK